jgi:putative tricarboxylic transport membrane protein
MRRAYQIAGLTFLLVAAFLGFHAYALRYFTSLGPGPGFFPVWLCALLGILALVVIVQATIASAEPLPEQFFAPRSGYVRIAAVLAALLGVTIFLPILGFRITLFAFYVGLLSLLDRRNLLETLFYALVGSLGVHYVFTEFLSQPLPVGRFGV